MLTLRPTYCCRDPDSPQEEVRKLQETFSEAAQQGEKLTEALSKYADEVTRIEWQKKRLMAQVLVLELKSEEYRREAEAAREELEEERRQHAAQSQQQLQQQPPGSAIPGSAIAIRSPIRTPRAGAGGGAAMGGAGGSWGGDEWDVSGTPNINDSWAGPPTAAFFTPKIVRLWAALNIPLVHRSRFYLVRGNLFKFSELISHGSLVP